MTDRVGEVIESSSTQFVAQCYELHSPPPLGSMVTVRDNDRDVMGVVFHASTFAIQPGRRPLARGMDESIEEDIYTSNPQLDKLLRTVFEALIVGYVDDGSAPSDGVVHQRLPPRPPRIHAFVYSCESEQAIPFSRSLDFIHFLVNSNAQAGDEVISACLRQLGHLQDDPEDYLVKAGRELSLLLAGEPQRLRTVLKGLKP